MDFLELLRRSTRSFFSFSSESESDEGASESSSEESDEELSEDELEGDLAGLKLRDLFLNCTLAGRRMLEGACFAGGGGCVGGGGFVGGGGLLPEGGENTAVYAAVLEDAAL